MTNSKPSFTDLICSDLKSFRLFIIIVDNNKWRNPDINGNAYQRVIIKLHNKKEVLPLNLITSLNKSFQEMLEEGKSTLPGYNPNLNGKNYHNRCIGHYLGLIPYNESTPPDRRLIQKLNNEFSLLQELSIPIIVWATPEVKKSIIKFAPFIVSHGISVNLP